MPPVFPTYTTAPFRSCSVFEVFKWILTSDGLEWLFTATSSNDRWEEASYFVCRTEEFTQPEVTEEAQGAYGP